jgi:hypothetical protein
LAGAALEHLTRVLAYFIRVLYPDKKEADMVDNVRRKELQQQYAERKPSVGVFAVQCAATGETWVAWSRSLDKRKNGIWFELRAGGGHGVTEIYPSWKAHGEDAFSYEILEELKEDNPHKLEILLEERADYWRTKLNAGTLPSR